MAASGKAQRDSAADCAAGQPNKKGTAGSWAPCEVCPKARPGFGAGVGPCHQLLTTGHKTWGAGPLLPIARLYDFAVYADGCQAQRWPLGRQLLAAGTDTAEAGPELWRGLRSAVDVEMSLVVRATRNLPIRLLRAEYSRILRRRLRSVGGSPDDPALEAVLSAFREEALPAAIKTGSSVKKGTTLTFVKRADGSLTAAADGHAISSVQSATLCAAVFDLYIGDSPVSKKSRTTALQRVASLIDGSGGGCAAPHGVGCAPRLPACGLDAYSWELAH